VFENRVLRGIFGPKRDGVTGNGEDYITRNFMICTDLNRVLRGIFGSKMNGVTGSGEDYITRNLMICTHHQILFR
jgi:hypothetical protein